MTEWKLPPLPGDVPLAIPPLFNPPLPAPTTSQQAVSAVKRGFHYGRPIVGLALALAAVSLGADFGTAALLIAAGALVRP